MEIHAQALSKSDLWGSVIVILVLLGTSPYPFKRLLSEVDRWSRLNKETVLAQTGHTPIHGLMIECYSFVDHSQIMKWIGEAEIVISQGGFGSLKDCLTAKKPTIAVPRRLDLGETMAEQCELVYALAREGRVIALENMEELAATVETARKMQIEEGRASAIPRIVAEEVDKVARK